MIITAIVKATILDGKQEELRSIADILEKNYAAHEDGCLLYESYIDNVTFITIERWADKKSLDIHLEKEHVKKYVPLMKKCIKDGKFHVQFIRGGDLSLVDI